MSNPLKLLIVDDIEIDAAAMVAELRRSGYQSHWRRAVTREAMLLALEEEAWDIVACDYELSFFSAAEALEALKQTGRDIPLIIVSGKVGVGRAASVINAGAFDFVGKAELSRLAPAIERALSKAESENSRKQTAEALEESEVRYRGLVETSQDLIWSIDVEGNWTFVNRRAALDMFGYEPEEIVGRPLAEFQNPDFEGNILDIREEIRAGRVVSDYETSFLKKDGTPVYINFMAIPLMDKNGQITGATGTARDVTAKKEAERALQTAYDELETRVEERTKDLTQEIVEREKAEEQLRLAARVIESTSEAVLIADHEFRVTAINPAFTKITGYDAEDIVGNIPHLEDSRTGEDPLYAQMWRAIEDHDQWEGEFWNRRKNGDEYAVRVSISTIKDEDGNTQQYAALINDITERKEADERIRFQANYDSLTGLPNRSLFLDQLDQAFDRVQRTHKKIALMFVDLDRFKWINDTLGHDAGDDLLLQVAERMKKCVRRVDTVARLGGDEFTIIMQDVDEEKHTRLVAEKVIEALSIPFKLKDKDANIGASIGITIGPTDASDTTTLLCNADLAMYAAKKAGRSTYKFFTPDMNEEAQIRLEVENDLRHAIERSELLVYYQPIVDLKTGCISSAEALIRWQHPKRGLVSPDEFIPLAEETGMIGPIGEFVLTTGCLQVKAWHDAGHTDLTVSVNLSSRQLREGLTTEVISRILESTRVPAEYLAFEITETQMMEDAQESMEWLGGIKNLGVRLSIDDFGTGYSSLSYLKKFPIDTLKIDKSFVNDMTNNADDASLVEAITAMARSLKLRVIAEGVETREQLDHLRNLGCDLIQGYYFSKPLLAADFESLLARGGENWQDRLTG